MENLYKSITQSDFIRGGIISLTIQLERLIDEYLARYFTDSNEKKLELMELLISDRMSFRDKSESFVQILKKGYNEKEFKLKYPKITSELQKISEDRNLFAHSMSLFPKEENKEIHKIVLLKFKNKVTPIEYTDEMLDEIVNRIRKYVNIISEINRHSNPL